MAGGSTRIRGASILFHRNGYMSFGCLKKKKISSCRLQTFSYLGNTRSVARPERQGTKKNPLLFDRLSGHDPQRHVALAYTDPAPPSISRIADGYAFLVKWQ